MTANDQSLEIEVKFYTTDPVGIKKRLVDMGATSSPNVFESNLRYEDNNRSFERNGQLLRLRQDTTCRLTFKSPPEIEDGEFKIFHELEVQVDNCTIMDAILQALGYRTVQVYEKWRETFNLGQTQICIDSMPFGVFLEIEGSRDDIQHVARQLGLQWPQRIIKNYLTLFDIIRQKNNLPFVDVTFANFKDQKIDIEAFLPLFFSEHSQS